MIGSFAKALKTMVRKPAVILPALFLPVLIFALILLFQGPLENFIFETIDLGNVPNSPLGLLPGQLFAMYPLELALIVVLEFATLFGWLFVGFFYARAANDLDAGNFSLSGAFRAATENLQNILVLSVFLFVAMAFFAALGWLFLLIPWMDGLVGIVLLALLALLLAYLFVKLAFAAVAMAIDDLNAKAALAKSWGFTSKGFWHTILFLAIISVVYGIAIAFADLVDVSIGIEEIGGIFFVIIWVLAIAFTCLSMAFYYLRQSVGK